MILLANIDMRCNKNHLAVLNLLDLQKGGNTIQDWVLHSLFHLTIGKIYYGICVSPSKDYWMLGLDLGNSYNFSKASHSILSHRSSNAEHIKKIFFQETVCQHRLPFTIMSELDMKVRCLFFFFKHWEDWCALCFCILSFNLQKNGQIEVMNRVYRTY